MISRENTFIHLEIPYMPHEGIAVAIGGLKLPFGRTRNPQASIQREVMIPEAIVLHTAKPFAIAEVEARPKTLRKHITEAWGMTIPCDVDVQLFAKGVRIGSPDHHVWSWIQHFYEEHGKKAMKIVGAKEGGLWGNQIWVDGRNEKEFVLLPIRGRNVSFGFSSYRMTERLGLADKTPMPKPTPERAAMTTNPI